MEKSAPFPFHCLELVTGQALAAAETAVIHPRRAHAVEVQPPEENRDRDQ
jgi:hypothetical protein